MAKKHEISEQTIYTRRKRFGAMQADDMKRVGAPAGYRLGGTGYAYRLSRDEGGEPETYDVILFGKNGETTFARFYGGDELR